VGNPSVLLNNLKRRITARLTGASRRGIAVSMDTRNRLNIIYA
jgi:hypothetical protein